MGQSVGSISLTFSAKYTKEQLLEEFGMDFFQDGELKLINMNGQAVYLEVHDFEYDDVQDVDEESYF